MWMCSIHHMQFLKCCSFDRSNDDVIVHDKKRHICFCLTTTGVGLSLDGICSSKMN